jgi:hypothetical protein
MGRRLRSERDRAQDALDLADRKVKRIEVRLEKLVEAATELNAELSAAKVVREYAARHPAL